MDKERNFRDSIMTRGSNSRGDSGSSVSLEDEIELLLLQQQQKNRNFALERERDLNINRSGSAPPTVEGALRSAGRIFNYPNSVQYDSDRGINSSRIDALTEEEIRSHPAYLEYYYSHENLNPRLPPPLLSKEDWRIAQRISAAGYGLGGVGAWPHRDFVDNSGSLPFISMQPSMSVKKSEDDMIELRKTALRNISRKSSSEFLNKSSNVSVGASSSEMGARRKSFADILQEGVGQHMASHLSRPVSLNSVGDALDTTVISDINRAEIQNAGECFEAMTSKKPYADFPISHNISTGLTSSVRAPLSKSLARGTELMGKGPSSGLVSVCTGGTPANNLKPVVSDNPNASSSGIFEVADIADSLSGLGMSNVRLNAEDTLKSSLQLGRSTRIIQNQNQPYVGQSRAGILDNNCSYVDLTREDEYVRELNAQKALLNERLSLPRRASSTSNLRSCLRPCDFATLEDLKILRQDHRLPVSLSMSDIANEQKFRSGSETGGHFPVMDPQKIQYMQHISNHARNAANMSGHSFQSRNCVGNLHGYEDSEALVRAYFEALLFQQKQQYQSHFSQNPSSIKQQYHWNPSFDAGAVLYQGNRVPTSVHSAISSENRMLNNEKSSHVPSTLRNLKGESTGLLHSQNGHNVKGRVDSLLEVVKNNKMIALELSDVLSHVIEFSKDQHGSRFIQQKLETSTVNDKMEIFSEIIPHAHDLMTDVFGNYIIQKFFEHGTESQRKELARHLIGHVLSLSLQMYGCRVIQKALEVVDIELQTEMVAELNGSVLKCVHDQNGNHVIQKCIECVPQDRIQFIISSFFGQVVQLSTHPYGCRVIQRVLEHYGDPKSQEIMMDEIMGSVCSLALDQYGNYVIQHVLQHGKPQERATIVRKLAGHIVKMSQQKFASNVIEKCLTFGGPEERKLLVNEILGTTEENAPLQVMMKDPFGNYVVQKVLETCDDHSRELILSRVKVHLNTLKKFTYGKHIVSLVEKLVATGEKHIGKSSSNAS